MEKCTKKWESRSQLNIILLYNLYIDICESELVFQTIIP